MTEPVEPTPPEGYTFLSVAEDLYPLCWEHPSVQYAWTWPQEANRFVVLHEECGAFVAVSRVGAHDTWHASLSA